MVNQTNAANSVSMREKGDIFRQDRNWGRLRFVKHDRLIDPDNGFIENDTIIIEASLDIYVKQTTSMTKYCFPLVYLIHLLF